MTDDELNEKKREFVKVELALKRLGRNTPGPEADELRGKHRQLFTEVTEENQRRDREAMRQRGPVVYGAPTFGTKKKPTPDLAESERSNARDGGEDK
jgi:hypothetical protein